MPVLYLTNDKLSVISTDEDYSLDAADIILQSTSEVFPVSCEVFTSIHDVEWYNLFDFINSFNKSQRIAEGMYLS